MSRYRTPPPFEPGPADRFLVLLCGLIIAGLLIYVVVEAVVA